MKLETLVVSSINGTIHDIEPKTFFEKTNTPNLDKNKTFFSLIFSNNNEQKSFKYSDSILSGSICKKLKSLSPFLPTLITPPIELNPHRPVLK